MLCFVLFVTTVCSILSKFSCVVPALMHLILVFKAVEPNGGVFEHAANVMRLPSLKVRSTAASELGLARKKASTLHDPTE